MTTDQDNIKKLIGLTREMLALADEGDRDRQDDSTGILYGILRDAAYKLRMAAEAELAKNTDTTIHGNKSIN